MINYNPRRNLLIFAVVAISMIVLSQESAHAVFITVFSEDFESPDVTNAQSDEYTNGTIPTGWIGSSNGFGSTRRGIVDEAHGDFTDPVGEQAFATRYTNTGLTTAQGVIGTVVSDQTILVSFDIVRDLHNSSTPYNVGLVVFDSGADRTDTRAMGNGTLAVLTSASGDATTDDLYTTISFSYTPDAIGDASLLDKDLAIRFVGSTNSAIIDNVNVSFDIFIPPVPEPSTAGLSIVGLIGIMKLRRKKRRIHVN